MLFGRIMTNQIKTEKVLIRAINSELTNKETPINFNFTEKREKFYFCGYPYNQYSCSDHYLIFDFSCAVEQINRAVDLLKNSLIKIKNLFIKYNIKVKITTDIIDSLLQLEKNFQTKMKDEQIKHQQKRNEEILFSSREMFQNISREYFQFVIKIKTDLIDYIKKNFLHYDTINSITENIQQQPNILPNELSSIKNNLNGYIIVYNLENFLRVLILIILKGLPSKQMMNEATYNYLTSEKRKERSNKWCDERYGGDLFYLTYSHLIDIIRYNESKFKESNINIDKINNEIEKVGIIRNKLAHNNIISKDDLETLKTYSKNIYKYFREFSDEIKNYKFNKKPTK